MGGKLGQLLVQTGYITAGQLSVALACQRRTHEPLARVIVDLGFLTTDALTRAVARAC